MKLSLYLLLGIILYFTPTLANTRSYTPCPSYNSIQSYTVVDCLGCTQPSTNITLDSLSGVIIRNCEFVGFNIGLLLIGCHNTTIYNNTVSGNQVSIGISVTLSTDIIIESNTIQDVDNAGSLLTGTMAGIQVSNSANVTIISNTVRKMVCSYQIAMSGIVVSETDNLNIDGNFVYALSYSVAIPSGNTDVYGIFSTDNSPATINANTIYDITAADGLSNAAHGVSVYQVSRSTVSVVTWNSVHDIIGGASTGTIAAGTSFGFTIVGAVGLSNKGTVSYNSVYNIIGGAGGAAGASIGIYYERGTQVFVAGNVITNIIGGSVLPPFGAGLKGGAANGIAVISVNATVISNTINGIESGSGGNITSAFNTPLTARPIGIRCTNATTLSLLAYNNMTNLTVGFIGYPDTGVNVTNTLSGALYLGACFPSCDIFKNLADDGTALACYPANDCCPDCTLSPPSQVCRASTGPCDSVDYCNGQVGCPANSLVSAGVVCAVAPGTCGSNSTCNGTSDQCPPTAPLPPGTVCRAAVGKCDKTEYCDGDSQLCPSDSYAPNTKVCRNGTNEWCFPTLNCTGTTTTCPVPPVTEGNYCEDTPFAACEVGVCKSDVCSSVGTCGANVNSGSCIGDPKHCYCYDFQLNSSFCYVPPTCKNATHSCNVNAKCVLVDAKNYGCVCNNGYQGNGFACKPGLCPDGFIYQGNKCVDINECLTLNGGCDFRVNCSNTNGSRICGPCPPGTVGDGETGCSTLLCGDTVCDPNIGENCVTCFADCKVRPCGLCGDRACQGAENCTNCREDCGLCATQQCPGSPPCSAHGSCAGSGLCTCSEGWAGPACDQPNIPVVIIVPPTDPGVVITPNTTKVSFTLSLREIREVSNTDDFIYGISLAGSNYTLSGVPMTNTKNKQWALNSTLENKAILGIVVFQFFDADTPISFAGDTTHYYTNQLKLSVRISDWPFKSLLNSLVLVFDTKATSGDKDGDECKSLSSGADSNGNLLWFKVDFNDASVYGQFLDNAEVDDTVRKIKFSLNKVDNSVSVKVPHFWRTLYVDPSYDVLVGEAACDSDNNNLLAVIIAVPVVVGVVGVAAAAYVFVLPKFKLWLQLQEAKKAEMKEFTKVDSN